MSLRKPCILAGKVTSFPDKTFGCDSNARSFLTFLYLRRNWFVSLSLVFHVVFLFSLVPLSISKTGGFYVALPVITLIFSMIFGFFAVLSVRRPKCSQCSKRMKKEWVFLEPNEKALFFICDRDRLYVNAFLKRKLAVKNEDSGAKIFLIRFFLFALFFPFINACFLSVCLFAKSVAGMNFGQIFLFLLSGVPVALLGMYITCPAILANAFGVACLFMIARSMAMRVVLLFVDGVLFLFFLQMLRIGELVYDERVLHILMVSLLTIFPTAFAFFLSRKHLMRGSP